MTRIASLASLLGGLFLLVSSALAAPAPSLDPSSAEQFVQACTLQLALDQQQSAGLRSYLEQEMEFMAVQRANHTAAEVAELLPAQRDELRRVAGRLMSPTQFRRFRELEATPQMQEYLRQMDLAL